MNWSEGVIYTLPDNRGSKQEVNISYRQVQRGEIYWFEVNVVHKNRSLTFALNMKELMDDINESIRENSVKEERQLLKYPNHPWVWFFAQCVSITTGSQNMEIKFWKDGDEEREDLWLSVPGLNKARFSFDKPEFTYIQGRQDLLPAQLRF